MKGCRHMANFSYSKVLHPWEGSLCDGEDLMFHKQLRMRVKGHEYLDRRITRGNFKLENIPLCFRLWCLFSYCFGVFFPLWKFLELCHSETVHTPRWPPLEPTRGCMSVPCCGCKRRKYFGRGMNPWPSLEKPFWAAPTLGRHFEDCHCGRLWRETRGHTSGVVSAHLCRRHGPPDPPVPRPTYAVSERDVSIFPQPVREYPVTQMGSNSEGSLPRASPGLNETAALGWWMVPVGSSDSALQEFRSQRECWPPWGGRFRLRPLLALAWHRSLNPSDRWLECSYSFYSNGVFI